MWTVMVMLVPVALALALGLGFVVAGCSPLGAFNTLVPADRGGTLAASDLPYGPHPRQRLDVYAPRDTTAAHPVVVVLYGGSWNSGSKADYAFLGKAIAARGYVAVVADYRLVPEVRFPTFLDDSAGAVVWAYAHAGAYGGDPARLFVLGHSAGAYNAAMIALDGRYLVKAGASPSIIKGVVALSGPYDFLPFDVASTIAAFGRAKDPAATQPVNFVTRSAPPMLLATGDDDTTVRPRNTYALAAKLKSVGATVTVKTYPGVGHVGILMATSMPFRSKAPVLDDMAAFIAATR